MNTNPYALRSRSTPTSTVVNTNMGTPEEERLDLRTLLLTMKGDMERNFLELKAQNVEIRKNIEALAQDTQSLTKTTEALKVENAKLQTETTALSNTIVCLKSELKKKSKKLSELETYTRRENLVFRGISQDTEEDCEQKVKRVIGNVMKITTDEMRFDLCHRIPGKRPQPIIVRFNWFQDRVKVYNARSTLQGHPISIHEDFPQEVVNNRRSLLPIMKKAREMDKFSVVRGDKLIIDQKTYTMDDLYLLPPELDPANCATAQHGDTLAFFGGLSPLSNFHGCNFTIDDKQYVSVEQYFQREKCLFANDVDAARKILSLTSPVLCKQLGDRALVDNDKWIPVAKEIMRKGMRAKFSQNQRAKSFLINTGDKILAEATLNRVWGTGLKLQDTKHTNRDWQGQNLTGEILMAVRQELKN